MRRDSWCTTTVLRQLTRLQLLVHSLRLSVGLGVETRCKADRNPQSLAKLPPELGNKLGAAVRNNVRGETMGMENVLEQDLCSVFSGWELG